MTIQEKLKLILKLSELTQAELAQRLGVTFAALNRWINGKAAPRAKAKTKIDEFYLECSGQKLIPKTVLEAKKNAVLKKRGRHRNVLSKILENPDIRDQFLLSLTYNSNRIEGSTLSENETAAILFQNASLPNKSLAEQLEAKNHQAALEFLFSYLSSARRIDEKLVLKLHGILMNAVRADAGAYRNHGVRILGANVPTVNYLKIAALMKKLMRDANRKTLDIIFQIADIHRRFEQIHPFADGNGRVGRLLMHAMALKNNFAPPVILQEARRVYISYLNKAQTKGDVSLLEDFLCEAILKGYEILER